MSDVLLNRLMAFRFQSGTPAFSFADRLARDNGWSHAYAKQVIREYLRFIYLCATSKQMSTPSEDVDQAWHLHMVYTRSYWDDLCDGILKFRLHHDPTRGGGEAGQTYAQAYQRTLDRYQEQFGEAPPSRVWPPVNQRFGRAATFRRVNLADHYLIPVRRAKAAVVAAGLGLAAAPVYAAADWVSLLTVAAGVVLIPLAVIGLFGAQMGMKKRTANKQSAAGCAGGTSAGSAKSDGSDGGDAGCGGGCGGCGG